MEANHLHPLCRLISDDEGDPNNQHTRLCTVAVTSSSHFKDEFLKSTDGDRCSKKEISFKTKVGIEEIEGRKYYEHVTHCCSSLAEDGTKTYLYISRAYRSN